MMGKFWICSRVDLNGGPDSRSGTVVRQTDFDVTIGQSLVSDSNPTCAVHIRTKTLSGGEVKVCLLP